MKDLKITATVTSNDGFFYSEQHEWKGISANAAAWFEKAMAGLESKAKSLATSSKGSLNAVLGATIDGKRQPDVTISGFNHDGLTKFQRHAHRLADELLTMGEQLAKTNA